MFSGWAELYTIPSALNIFFGSVLTMCSNSITDLQNVPYGKSGCFLLSHPVTTAISEGDLGLHKRVMRRISGRELCPKPDLDQTANSCQVSSPQLIQNQ